MLVGLPRKVRHPAGLTRAVMHDQTSTNILRLVPIRSFPCSDIIAGGFEITLGPVSHTVPEEQSQ